MGRSKMLVVESRARCRSWDNERGEMIFYESRSIARRWELWSDDQICTVRSCTFYCESPPSSSNRLADIFPLPRRFDVCAQPQGRWGSHPFKYPLCALIDPWRSHARNEKLGPRSVRLIHIMVCNVMYIFYCFWFYFHMRWHHRAVVNANGYT